MTAQTVAPSVPTRSAATTARGLVLSVLATTAGAGVLNTVIAFAARGLGADATLVVGLQPASYLLFTLIGSLLGAVGWIVVRRSAADPARVLRWLVPTAVAVSLIPDVLFAVAFSAIGGVAFGLMHLAVAAVAVPVYRRFLPLGR